MHRPHIVIIVQNLPVPLDRRVWLEAQALRDGGYEVSVICPKGPGDPSYAVLDGVHLYKYRPSAPASGPVGYIVEFAYCWVRTALLTARVARRRRFDVLQACNPPDTYWVLARIWKVLRRGRVDFVFDHHDLNPEVFLSRFGRPSTRSGRLQLACLRWLERRTMACADHVISTNESYRAIATARGGVSAERSTVVRSGPDTERMRPVRPLAELRHGRRELIVYLGVMGPQDGVDIVLRAAERLIRTHGRDLHVALLGFGDCLTALKALARQLGLTDHVTFTGRADASMVADYLSSADIGLSPDPSSPLNDVSTMNKTMEYLAYALPVVAFDLTETRVTGGDAVAYVDPVGDPNDAISRYADAIGTLLRNSRCRESMALAGRRRAETVLDWGHQRTAYISVFDRLTGWHQSGLPHRSRSQPTGTEPPAGERIDVSDDRAIRHLVDLRSACSSPPDSAIEGATAGGPT